MEFRETLLAAQRNQQQKSSVGNSYYRARFDPPKKEQKPRDKLSANIQKFLAKKEEEEKQKQLDNQRKRDELLAMRDPKALRKIQKTLKVIKSANKSVLADAIDKDHTAVTLVGPDQPDQDDYGYESQEAAALYEKMMQKYSKLPDQPKFPSSTNNVSKDIHGTRERVKHALQHEDEPVPHKRRRRTENGERDTSPLQRYEPERKKDEKLEKPKIRKPAPPPMDFNQLLKLAEQKKSEPLEVVSKKIISEPEPERPMTKKQKREYEEEMSRRQRKQMRIDSEKAGRKVPKEERTMEKERKPEPGFGRIPKLSDKNSTTTRTETPKTHDKERERYNSDREKNDKVREEILRKERAREDLLRKERAREDVLRRDKERAREDVLGREKDRSKLDREKIEKDKLRLDKERLDKLKAERDRIDREMEKLNKDREKIDKTKAKLETRSIDKGRSDRLVDRSKLSSKERDDKKSIELKSQNTYRIDKNSNEKRSSLPNKSSDKLNGHSSQGKPVPKLTKEQIVYRNDIKDRAALLKQKSSLGESSPKLNGFAKYNEASKGLPKRPDDKRPNSNGKSVAPNKSGISNSFDFDKHVNSLCKNGSKFPPGDVKRKPNPNDIRKKQKRRMVDSDSEYDSEMDDFIDDGDENMDYSKHIKEIFGYDKFKYRDMDDGDDPTMESSFARQQREEYISKKFGIMEDLEDMRMEALEKSKKKKSRRLSDD